MSVVAANWQGLPEWLRLLLLLGSMGGAYAGGEYFLARKNESLGIGLIGLGLILFGCGIILTSQMYQLIGYDAPGLLAWALAGTALTYLYRSRTIFVLMACIGGIVQGYSTGQLGSFSYLTAALTVVGLGYYWWRHPDALLGTVLATGLLWQAGLLIGHLHAKITWFFIPAMLIYAVGDWQTDRSAGRALQTPPWPRLSCLPWAWPSTARPTPTPACCGHRFWPTSGPCWRCLPCRGGASTAGAAPAAPPTGSCCCPASTCTAVWHWPLPRW
ncbi:DUF2157 domain-containing protein [Hymenobacter cellulosilyticus]|uniref:DUF2157 domain-containing protein n=1 Tax=Hymenobacter cellulosilyticus TaxID=2932248 RepID=A0A8T9QJH9_9BACT|nr:DUF2157 domain-containing protein [Hymenobacter cellulosilyticus]UOQ74933.1 DUF2157 domain-containing protein [Hymenobacter cellulosilyticus]